MSGITPLLDTLLHQVLGKRADVPPPRDLNPPVKPTAPAEAPRAVHSDSRLETRAPAPTSEAAAHTDRRGTGPPASPAGPQAPASALTHFSASARTIAEALQRFPAPSAALSPAAPLVSAGHLSTPDILARRLEGSVRDSGLFYESHLARWYRGELTRQQLEREPQMWRTQRFTPVTASSAPLSSVLLPASPKPNEAVGATAGEVEFRSRGLPDTVPVGRPMEGGREPVHESLQGLLRHQLEMLVTPSLRWEGDVWSGLFMALVIHLPQGSRDGRGEGDDHARRGEREPGGWRSDLTLEVAGLGPLEVSLWMTEVRLEIDLKACDASMRARLEGEAEALRRRLEGQGFDEVQLRLGVSAGEGAT